MDGNRAMPLGQGAYDYVKSRLHLGASNDPLNVSGWIGEDGFSISQRSVVSTCVGLTRDGMSGFRRASPEATKLEILLEKADRADKAGCGNCGEQSALAFAWLMRLRAVPVEVMSISNGDHAFCVLNRDANTDPADPDQWNEAAVYIDPWRSLLSFGREMSVKNRSNWFGLGSVKYHFQVDLRLDG